MNLKLQKFIICFAGVVILLGSSVVIFFPPGDPRIICHRGLDGAIQQWRQETHQIKVFPNVEGSSSKSLAVLSPYCGAGPMGEDFKDYGYVPGLEVGDPADLVMFYVKRASHRRWHGDHPTVFGAKRWILLPCGYTDDEIELNEWVTAAELKDRIQQTLDFLKANNRPNWQAIVSEQTKYLELIHD